ncbi:C45 family autoproteolytic acyltransferase/hydolase [Natrarchaeobius chitinivorans]|uniref:Peptidase C45 n=1 Tax=Natrarchaeobius chitinivorans TaxID=1679083 RepID=A0A3N6P7U7_NATCH|nr:C45 family peptidase [Natrarchaeobius chitinivorans]RQG94579.1 peptidase C45 [Natrarchaeobius chitinivorans]
MNEIDVETTGYDDAIARADTFAAQARRRAETEREAVEWAIGELEALVDTQGVDLEPLLEYSRRSRESLPDRHRRAYEAMADEFDVDPDVYEAYVFAFSELCEELADGTGRSEKNPKGCTNALVSGPKLATESDADGPLVLKNRDIAGRGVRPKSIVEQPPIDDYHGFLTIDTCGTISIFKGVNDRGLVAANTHIDSERDDVDPEDQLRNGTVIRILLEECATVSEARTVLESYPTRRLMGQTLFLADGTDAILLEVDPVAERIAVDDEPIVTRTNHFVNSRSTETESSTIRRERALEELEGDGRLDRDDLWEIARDHENRPGDDSVCRHPEPETDEPHAFGQLTTASTAVFEGGSPTIEVAMGNPCGTERTQCAFGDEIPTAFRTGQRWLSQVKESKT